MTLDGSAQKVPENEIKAACVVICKKGVLETGEGTCAMECLQLLGDARRSCPYVVNVHGRLATAMLEAAAEVRGKEG